MPTIAVRADGRYVVEFRGKRYGAYRTREMAEYRSEQLSRSARKLRTVVQPRIEDILFDHALSRL